MIEESDIAGISIVAMKGKGRLVNDMYRSVYEQGSSERKRREKVKSSNYVHQKYRLHRRFPRYHQVHGREQLLLAARHQAIGRDGHAVCRFLGALGRNANPLQAADEIVHGCPADLGHARDGQQVTEALRHAQVAVERVVPWARVIAVGQILVHLQLEASGLDGAQALGHAHHVGDAVALLYA